jgi:iron(III) transport system ATP-binding protein
MPDQLSGGQQQRVALGRALAQEPDVLLMDEPFSNLDASLRARVRSDVHELLAGIGITTVMVTHDRDEAFVLGDTVALMRDGAIVQLGTPEEVYRTPSDRWCARFVGEANMLPATAEGTTADSSLGTLRLVEKRDGPVEVVLRPEELAIAPHARPTAQRAGTTPGTVSLVEYHGPRTHYLVEVGGSVLRVESAGPPTCSVGDRVEVAVADRAFPAFGP